MRFRSRAKGAALAAAALFAGCAGSPAPRAPIEATPLGERLSGLWSAYGGLDAWRRVRGVVFSYRAEGTLGSIRWEKLALRFDRPGLVFIGRGDGDGSRGREGNGGGRQRGGGERRNAAGTWKGAGDWEIADLRTVPALKHAPHELESFPLESPLEDLSLRSAALFFHPGFLTCARGVELRRLIAPPEHQSDADRHLEIDSTWDSALGPVLFLKALGASAPLSKGLYASRHPALPRGPHVIEFRENRRVRDILVPTRRVHRLLRRPDAEPPDPLRPELFPEAPEPAPLLIEEIGAIRWLTGPEVEGLPELPERQREISAGEDVPDRP